MKNNIDKTVYLFDIFIMHSSNATFINVNRFQVVRAINYPGCKCLGSFVIIKTSFVFKESFGKRNND